MKTIDLFCASPASTAICSSMDQRSVIRHVTRPISRHAKTLPLLPCQSQLPIDPKSLYHKNRKSTSSSKQSDSQRKSSADKNDLSSPPGSTRYLLSDTPFFDMLSDSDHVKASVPSQIMRHGHLSPNDSPSSQYPSRGRHSDHIKALVPSNKLKSGHLSSPIYSPRGRDSDHVKALVPGNKLIPGHLSSTKHSPRRQDSEPVNVLVPSHKMRQENIMSSDSPSLKSSSTRSRPRDKVVELWVSIHCRGCEGKVRKHISRMEGVTSFSIDLATKKVTIIGDVTPLGVLTSVSRVKNAQFWPSPTLSSSLSSSPVVDRGYQQKTLKILSH